jgi:hypothetical protein
MKLKYRVWCKNKNEWEKDPCFISMPGQLWFYNNNSLRPAEENHECDPMAHVVQLCTWLKDKTGKYIFEGDIVNIGYNFIGNIAVIFKDGGFNIKDYCVEGRKIIGHVNDGKTKEK